MIARTYDKMSACKGWRITSLLVTALAVAGCSKLPIVGEAPTELTSAKITPASVQRPSVKQAPRPVSRRKLALSEAVRMALQRHPDIRRAMAYVEKSRTGIRLAASVWYPELSYNVAPGYSKANYGSATIGASQLVYDFGKSSAEQNAAKAQLAKSNHEVDEAREAVAAQLAQDYAVLAASVAQIDLARSYLAEQKKLASRVSSRVEAGASDASDESTALVAVDRAQAEILKADSQFSVAQSNIAEVLGVRPNRVASMQDIAAQLDSIMGSASGQVSPSILALESAVEAARHNVEQARAQAMPPVKIVGQYSESASDEGFSGSSYLGVQVSGAYSTSGAAGMRVEAAVSELEAARQLLASERLRIRTNIGASSVDIETANKRVQNARQIHRLAKKSGDLSWQEYQLNKKPLNEVISAEREKYMALSDIIAARNDVIRAKIRFLSNRGELAYGLLWSDHQ